MSNSSLSQRALLVQVQISQWTARRRDETATDTVIKEHKTELSAGQYTKKLLPGARELEDVSRLAGQVRKYFYEQTLPWMADGARIISAKNHLKFAAEFRKMKSDFEAAVNDFISAYPRLRSEAQKALGGLYNSSEYPGDSAIKEKFSCEVFYLPMPDAKDFRIEISEAQKKDFTRKIKETEAVAMRDAWSRLHKVVKGAADRLSQPDAIFRDSLLENVKELCELLPALNISDDKDLEKQRREVETLISRLSPDSLRESKSSREQAAKDLKEITDKMGAFMGGVKWSLN